MAKIQNLVVILVGIAVTWWLLSQALSLLISVADVLAIFGFAWLLNLLLEPFVSRVARHIPLAAAWAVGYICVLLVMVALGAPLATQATALPDTLPATIESVTVQADQFLLWLGEHGVRVSPTFLRSIESGEFAQQVGGIVLSWSIALLNIGGQTLLVIGVAAAMSAGDDSLRSLLRALVPERWAPEAHWLYDDVERTYAAAVRGQLAIWALGMLLSLGTMALFNTPNILLWIGPLALVRLLPYLGGILGGGLTILILLLSLPWPLALLPALIVIIGQNIMGYIVEPRLLGRILHLSPGLVLFVVLIGWKLGGVTGIAFGVPAVAVVQAVAERLIYRREGRQQPLENSAVRPVNVPVPSSASASQRTEAAQSQ